MRNDKGETRDFNDWGHSNVDTAVFLQKKRRSGWIRKRANDCDEILFEGNTTRTSSYDKKKKKCLGK